MVYYVIMISPISENMYETLQSIQNPTIEEEAYAILNCKDFEFDHIIPMIKHKTQFIVRLLIERCMSYIYKPEYDSEYHFRVLLAIPDIRNIVYELADSSNIINIYKQTSCPSLNEIDIARKKVSQVDASYLNKILFRHCKYYDDFIIYFEHDIEMNNDWSIFHKLLYTLIDDDLHKQITSELITKYPYISSLGYFSRYKMKKGILAKYVNDSPLGSSDDEMVLHFLINHPKINL